MQLNNKRQMCTEKQNKDNNSDNFKEKQCCQVNNSE